MSSNNIGLTYGGQEKSPSLSGETEFAAEAGAPGGLFHADYKRHDDLKQMLDSSKDSLKLEAMKRIIGVNMMILCICKQYSNQNVNILRWWPKEEMLRIYFLLW